MRINLAHKTTLKYVYSKINIIKVMCLKIINSIILLTLI